MIVTLRLVLEILALVSFAAAALNVPARLNLIAVGLFLWILAVILG